MTPETAPELIGIPDDRWVEETGKPESVIAYTRGDDDGYPDEDDTIVMRESHKQALLNGKAPRKVLFTIVHELGHNYDRDRDGFDPVYDHPVWEKGQRLACFKDAVLVKKFSTMSFAYQFQWFKSPARPWEDLDAYVNMWREQYGL